jgi:hypothetical protein
MAIKKTDIGEINELLDSFAPRSIDGIEDDVSKYDTDPILDPSEIDDEPEIDKKEIVADPLKQKDQKEDESIEKPKPVKIKKPIEPIIPEEDEDEVKKVEELEPVDIDEVDLSDIEPEIAALFQEKLYQELGITKEEDDEMKTIDDVIGYVKAMVEEYSQPVFANEEVEKLNKYVEDGGDLKTYFNYRYGGVVDINKVNLEKEADQQAVIREYFKTLEKDYPEEKIEKRIQRYDETGSLKEEAEEAHEWLKNYREKESKKLLVEQENVRKESEKQQLKFQNDVISYIRSSKAINGIQLNTKEKEQLVRDIFAVDKEGKTNYQKRYTENLTKNLVDSAFNTMFGDKYYKEISKKADSEAALKLKKKLEISKKTPKLKSSDSVEQSSPDELFTQFGNMLTGLK